MNAQERDCVMILIAFAKGEERKGNGLATEALRKWDEARGVESNKLIDQDDDELHG